MWITRIQNTRMQGYRKEKQVYRYACIQVYKFQEYKCTGIQEGEILKTKH